MSELERLSPEAAKVLIDQVVVLMKQSPLYVTTLIENIFSEDNPETNQIRDDIVGAIKSRITPMLVKNLLSEKVTEDVVMMLLSNHILSIDQLNPENLKTKVNDSISEFLALNGPTLQSVVGELQVKSTEEVRNSIDKIVEHVATSIPESVDDKLKNLIESYLSTPEFKEQTATYIKDAVDEKLKFVFKLHELKLDEAIRRVSSDDPDMQYTNIQVRSDLAEKATKLLQVAFGINS